MRAGAGLLLLTTLLLGGVSAAPSTPACDPRHRSTVVVGRLTVPCVPFRQAQSRAAPVLPRLVLYWHGGWQVGTA